MAVTKIDYGQGNCSGQRSPPNSYTAVYQDNIPVKSLRQRTPAGCIQWKDTSQEAVFNFAQFYIPQGVKIRSATLYSSTTSTGCQAGFVSGKVGNVSAGSFSSSGFSSSGRFGSGALIRSWTYYGCIFPGVRWYCGGCYDPVLVCGSSGLASGTGNVTDNIQSFVNTQNLTNAAFWVRPDGPYHLLCYASNDASSGETGNFTVNDPGPARLTIDYCGAAPPTPTPTPTPVPLYSISGRIFNDANGNGKSSGDSNYTGSVAISRSPNLGSFASFGGNYSFTELPQGQYAITFSGLPQGLIFTYPFSSLIVAVGPGCSYPITSEASCSGNSIFNLNAGVTNLADAWFQSIGSDMRWDSGFTNTLPQNKYASILGTGGMPGIIFSGTSTPSFGSGQASQSPFNWKVGSFEHREVFTDTHNLIPTSYRFLLETAQSAGITLTNISTLDSSIQHGIYKVNGDLNLNGSSYTFGPGNFIILIDGNLNINKKILVPVGSTAIFSAKGNITVNRAIGEPASSTTPTLEGLYSADGNFVADGNSNCSITSDLRLNIAGTVVANAGRGGGTFVNNRDLCAGNAANPSVSFIERPDFLLNYPNLVQQTTRAWQDVAP